MANLKQFNFKIRQDLYEQLSLAAKARGAKMTDLIIEGIESVLGITARSSRFGVDMVADQLIDQLKIRVEKVEKDQASIVHNIHQYIPRLEGELQQLKTSAGIAESIAQDVYQKLLEEPRLKDIVANIVNELGLSQSGTGTVSNQQKEEEIEKPEANQVKQLPESQLAHENSPKEALEGTQLEFVSLENSKDNLLANAKKVESREMLEILRNTSPSKNWSHQTLTAYRKLKKHLSRWNQVETCRFMYAGEEKPKDSKVAKHFWWVIPEIQE